MATRSVDARGLVLTVKLGLITAGLAVAGCRGGGGGGGASDDGGVISLSKPEPAAQAAPDPDDPATMPKADGPRIGAVQMVVTIYEKPDPRSEKIGYLRLGATLPRGEKPVKFDTCRGGYYRVLPKGYVCVDEGASIDLNHPLLKAGLKPPDRTKPLPYTYAFVRAIAPRYYRLPTKKEQFQYEMALDRHIRSFKRLGDKWNTIEVGSNDVPVDAQGRVLGDTPEEPPAMTEPQKFGGDAAGTIPWFFEGTRQIPNVSNFAVPDYAVITNRVARHAGLSLLGAIEGDDRLFALTTDLRLVPASKLKPGRGATFHGVELSKGWEFPMAFVKTDDAYRFDRKHGGKKKTRLALFTPVQLTGEVRGEGEDRMVETNDGDWLKSKDLAVIVKTSSLPSFVKDKTKWIDVSIQQQTLVLYEGSKPMYATLVSTGRDGLGDPAKTLSTPRGTFHIREKHVTTTMDSDVVGSKFELQDVPYVQYFQHGYAIHASYWHTDYGRPRSHGCINMAPIDAMRAFWWTDPPVPEGWHGVHSGESFGEGTIINIHP